MLITSSKGEYSVTLGYSAPKSVLTTFKNMSFEDQLKKAITRGSRSNEQAKEAERLKKLSQEELKNIYNGFRLQLSEHIEQNLEKVVNLIPGFRYETVYGERGWGGAISRDDVLRGGTFYSRLEITVRPFSDANLLAIIGRGTIRNRELLSWNHFSELENVQLNSFIEQIDSWILQYVEQFSNK